MRARGVEAGIGKAGFGVMSVSAAKRDLALCFFEEFFDESKVVEIKKRAAKRKPEKTSFLGLIYCGRNRSTALDCV